MYKGMEVDLNMLKKMSTEYAVAKKQAIEGTFFAISLALYQPLQYA